MTDRASTLLSGRRERLERLLERELKPPVADSSSPIPAPVREFLCEEAEYLYWHELALANITAEAALESVPLPPLTLPRFFSLPPPPFIIFTLIYLII